MKSGIYKITCIANGMIYVGCSQNIEARRQSHFSPLRSGNHPNRLMQSDFNKHGESNFIFEFIEPCAAIHFPKREKFYIVSLKANYNLGQGGKRNGSGRKPVADKKEPVTSFIQGSIINAFGGKDELKKFIERKVTSERKQLKQIQGK